MPGFDVPAELQPHLQYQAKGYSLKQLVATIGASVSSIGLVGLMFYIVITLFKAVPKETIKIAGTVLLFGIVGLILVGSTMFMVAFVNNLRKPGIQMPQFEKLEKTIGWD